MIHSSRTFRVVALALPVLLSIALTALAHEEEKSKEGKEVTLDGEVLDLYCYMKHPEKGQGLEHAKCATSCINRGLPIGFLSGEEVYLLIGKEHESVAELVAGLAGVQSRLTGILFDHHGVKSIEVVSITKLEKQ